MEAVKILEGRDPVVRIYDEEADILYISQGSAGVALGIDVGDGVILRCDGGAREIVGVSLIGLRANLLRELSDEI
jgi:uncharacterized protein YuzE